MVSRPSTWGNPFHVMRAGPGWQVTGPDVAVARFDSDYDARADAVERYRQLLSPDRIERARTELRGHDLACWCPLVDEHGRRVSCHADVLLEIANRR